MHLPTSASGREGARSPRTPASSPSDAGRFLPGALLLERYRVHGLLGRGGMGEVYRADDLKLGQQVSLKFLPPVLAEDPDRLERFHGEVRLARQVSHPNVCRVYDIGEVDGQVFLSMEYIDGENLATLLRRIRRLPGDKAVEIGRQLCAGLAAAHDRKVLHRDLKPANVMLDGLGQARITDFGLASLSGESDRPGDRSGTPVYMAPELLAGGDATERSDIYALGLVLYELFTGKRAFQGETIRDLVRSHEASTPTPPTTLVEGLDPAVERVILRCLENDPRQRPQSARAVAAGLPGGDPLAMALAAGETPSPEMVAAAGEAGAISPRIARASLLGIVAGIVALAWLSDQAGLLGRLPPPKPLDALVDRTQDIIRRAGYTDRPAGVAYGYGYHRSYLEHIRDTDPSSSRWERLAKAHPQALYLWYRQSPKVLEAANAGGEVGLSDPPLEVPGMVSTMLTASGELWDLQAVPPQVEDTPGSDAPPDWAPLFADAGLRMEAFTPVEPRWVPQIFGDARAAWEGAYADAPELRVRVEAASFRGRPVAFHVYWPWNRPLRARPFENSAGEKIARDIIFSLIFAALVGGAVLARANIRMGRVDRKGAFRLAGCVCATSLVANLCRASHVPNLPDEWGLLSRLFGSVLFDGFAVWLFYMALEPVVRRRWPDRIISWARLLSGRLRDPMVGRDLLVGLAFGVGLALTQNAVHLLPGWIGRPPAMPAAQDYDILQGPRVWVGQTANTLTQIVLESLVMLFMLVTGRLLARRQWAATAGFFLMSVALYSLLFSGAVGAFAPVFGCVAGLAFTVALVRFGLLALAATLFAHNLLLVFPLSASVASWYAAPGLFLYLVLAALVVHACAAALAGRSLFAGRAVQE